MNSHAAKLREMAKNERRIGNSYAETAPEVSAEYLGRAAALLAGAAALEAQEWRPISEAPRDGTAVLLCGMDAGCPYVLVGYFWRLAGKWSVEPHYPPPTHYRPLPAGPGQAGEPT